MPIISISDIVLEEIKSLRFSFGGTAADVVEYPDGGRMASAQAVSAEALEAVSDVWISVEPSIVPTSDEHGMIAEFFGPPGILALRVDFGYGPVVMRADAATLHRELRDILISRLAQVSVDEENFRGVVSAEVNAIRTRVDTVVADTLAQVDAIIAEQQIGTISDLVKQELSGQLAPVVDERITNALDATVPAMLDSKIPPVVTSKVNSAIAPLTTRVSTAEGKITQLGTVDANLRYDLDAAMRNLTTVTNRVTAAESKLAISSWSKTWKTSDCTIVLRLQRFQSIVIGTIDFTANKTNAGATGWTARAGMGIPSAYLPDGDGVTVSAAANAADGTLIDPENYRVGISPNGEVFSQGYKPWHKLRASLAYFT
ncbi:hypothetical protein ACFVH6_25685 [Spirillospora sp. NPDC127200]